MRNEIYEKIKQSRMRYIAELKNAEFIKSENEEQKRDADYENYNEGNEKLKSPGRFIGASFITKIGDFKNAAGNKLTNRFFTTQSDNADRKSFQSLIFPQIKLIASGMLYALKRGGRLIRSVTDSLLNKISPVFSSMNRKINTTADKMTDGFYNYSSRFFEDRYEYVEMSDKSGVSSIAISPAVSGIYENEILDSAALFLNRLWGKMSKTGFVRGIVLFLEIDDEISDNKSQYRPVLEDKTVEAGRSTVQKFVNVFSIGYHKVVKAISRQKRSMKKIYRYIPELSVNNFKPIVKKFKAKLKQINFPAINRFV